MMHIAVQDIDKSYFVAFCIEQYKAEKGLSGKETAELFYEKGVADYLSEHFNVLHTQSRQWLMEEIDEFLEQRQ